MPRKTVSSTLALAAAGVFALSSAAFAQTMVGDQEVSSEDLAAVTAHCETLASAETGAPTTDDMAATTDGTMAGDDAATDEMATGATDDMATDGGDMAADGDMAGGVDLDAITLADCQSAGIGTQ